MMQDLYPWLEQPWEQCKTILDSDRVPGAILLIAPNGLGVNVLVERFRSSLMCVNYESEACGFCHSCELMKSGSHPDVHTISPEKEGKSITVDQIRASNRWAQESSHLDGYRLIVVEPAEAMNEAASNALLKTLEEPADKCIFLLVSPAIERLMPTIVSRCQQWKVTPPSAVSGEAWLKQEHGKAIPNYVLPLCSGMPLDALAMLKSGEIEECQQVFDGYLTYVKQVNSDLLALGALINKHPSRNLMWLWHLLTDTQKVAFGIADNGIIPLSRELAEEMSYQQAFNKAKSLLTLIDQLRQHSGLNTELLIINWLIAAREESCS